MCWALFSTWPLVKEINLSLCSGWSLGRVTIVVYVGSSGARQQGWMLYLKVSSWLGQACFHLSVTQVLFCIIRRNAKFLRFGWEVALKRIHAKYHAFFQQRVTEFYVPCIIPDASTIELKAAHLWFASWPFRGLRENQTVGQTVVGVQWWTGCQARRADSPGSLV